MVFISNSMELSLSVRVTSSTSCELPKEVISYSIFQQVSPFSWFDLFGLFHYDLKMAKLSSRDFWIVSKLMKMIPCPGTTRPNLGTTPAYNAPTPSFDTTCLKQSNVFLYCEACVPCIRVCIFVTFLDKWKRFVLYRKNRSVSN